MDDNKNKWVRPKEVEPQHKELMIQIGKKLEKLRNNKKLGSYEFAYNLFISRNAYSQMERGQIYFSFHNLLKILDYHHIDLNTFIKTELKDL